MIPSKAEAEILDQCQMPSSAAQGVGAAGKQRLQRTVVRKRGMAVPAVAAGLAAAAAMAIAAAAVTTAAIAAPMTVTPCLIL